MKSLLLSLLLLSVTAANGQQPAERIVPPRFVTENTGQWHNGILFQDDRNTAWFMKEGIAFRTAPAAEIALGSEMPLPERNGFAMTFIDPSPRMTVEGGGSSQGTSAFYVAGDGRHRREGVRNYSGVRYNNVWDGVDVEYTFADGGLRQTLHLKDKDALKNVRFRTSETEAQSQVLRLPPEQGGGRVRFSIAGDGTAAFAPLDTLPDTALTLPTEFSTYFGGTATDFGESIHVDDAGNIYVAGMSHSSDFPLLNSFFDITWQTSYRAVLTKFACDGATVIYSTYTAAYNCKKGGLNWTGAGWGSGGVEVTPGGIAIIAGTTRANAILPEEACDSLPPLTDTRILPLQYSESDLYLMKIAPDGRLLQNNLIGNSGGTKTLMDWEVDKNGEVHLYGHLIANYDCGFLLIDSHGCIPDSTWCLWNTPAAFTPFMPSPTYRPAPTPEFPKRITAVFYLRVAASCDSIVYGTYLWDYDEFYDGTGENDIEVDNDGNVIFGWDLNLAFEGSAGRVLPLKNQLYDTTIGVQTMYIIKFTPEFDDIVFATFLSSTQWGTDNPGNIFVDRTNNIYIQGMSREAHLPSATLLYPGIGNNTVPYIGKLSPSGAWLGAQMFNTSCRIGDLHIDAKNRLVYGLSYGYSQTSPSYPVTHEIDGVPPPPVSYSNQNSYVTVFDTSLTTMEYSVKIASGSLWGGYGGFMEFDDHAIATLDNGYLYILGTSSSTAAPIKFWNPSDTSSASANNIIIRMLPPINDPRDPEYEDDALSVVIDAPDTLVFNTNRERFYPAKFTVRATIMNVSPNGRAWHPSTTIHLPKGLKFNPPGQSVTFGLAGPIQPGKSVSASWTVSADTSFRGSPERAIAVSADFYKDDLYRNCPIFTTQGRHPFAVFEYAFPEPRSTCSLSTPDTLRVAGDTIVAPSPFTLHCLIVNPGPSDEHLASATLQLAGGITLAPGETAERPDLTIPGNGNRTLSWQLNAALFPTETQAHLAVHLADTLGEVYDSCMINIVLPAGRGLACRLSAPDTIFVDFGSVHPNPFMARLDIVNYLNAVHQSVEAELDLTEARHIALASGQAARAQLGAAGLLDTVGTAWQLEVVNLPIADTIDVITVKYRSDLDQEWRTCAIAVHFRVSGVKPECILNGPPVLAADNAAYNYVPNPFDVDYTLTNPFDTDLNVRSVTIFPPNDIYVQDSATHLVSPLPPHDSYQFTWTLTARRSAFERRATIWVIANDAENRPLAECQHPLFLASLTDMTCIASAPDSVRYDSQSGSWSPNPVIASLTVYNHVDTVQVEIDAEIVLTGVYGLILISSERVLKQIDTLGIEESHRFDWQLHVIAAAQTVRDTLIMRYRTLTHPEWRECSAEIVIESSSTPVDGAPAPADYVLYQNYPNPFSSSTTIEFSVPAQTDAVLTVYNPLGESVSAKRIAAQPGRNSAIINGLAPGVYLYVLQTRHGILTRRMVME